MAFEQTYNLELAKDLIRVQNPAAHLDEQLQQIKKRALELNQAREMMADGYSKVLRGLQMAYPQIDSNDPNLKDTPDRVARALIEICSGLGVSDKEVFSSKFPSGSYDEMVMLKNIEYTSLCSHHFFPFVGHTHIGYLPALPSAGNEGQVVGLSKLARIVDVHSRRPQLQERMCSDIMNAIAQELRPEGVMVVIEGKHECMGCRGIKKREATMITSAVYGKFKDSNQLRTEFLDLLKLRM